MGCESQKNHLRRRRGAALLLVLIAVAISATLALSFLSAQSTTIGIARNIQNHSPARHVAESGLELAIAYVRADDDWRTDRPNGTWVTNESYAGGTFTIVGEDGEDTNGDGVVEGDGDLADDTSDLLTLTVTGTVNGASHVVRTVLTPGAAYELLVAGADTESAVTLAGSVTSNLPDYIGPGTKICVLAVSADRKTGGPKNNILYTDYMSITITSGGGGVVYDYANRIQGTDIFVYSDAATSQLPTDDATPGGPSTVLDAQEYDDIEADDGTLFSHAASSSNEYVRHRFEIELDEDEADVTRIDVTWSGKGVNENNGRTDGAWLYICRYSGAGGYTVRWSE